MGEPTDLDEASDLDPDLSQAPDPESESDNGPDQESHRGAFGEFGGESPGLIDRTFRERIVLAGVTLGRSDPEATDASMDELARLVETAGADPVARVLQHRDSPDRATYVGKGKVMEIKTVSEALDADTVVFDNDLTPAQQGNLEEILKRSALDRTAVILDIFAQNASSPEGRAQVELAQLRYRLPRLRRSGRTFSQQAGGIGTRGPGETQLEVDRRRLMRRITRLESDLRRIRGNRATQSKARKRTSNRAVAIVGYTNAGKSTLFNALSDAKVTAADQLFSTLDPVTRRIRLPSGAQLLLSDTVGFIQKLSPKVVAAFRATLEELQQSDILLHVIDVAHPKAPEQTRVVEETLRDLGLMDRPRILVMNKMDLIAERSLDNSNGDSPSLPAHEAQSGILVSAAKGWNLDDLLREIEETLIDMDGPLTVVDTAGSSRGL